MGDSIRAKDETKREILRWINREVAVQVRQGKGNRIKKSKEGRTGVRGETQEGPKKVLPPETPGDVGASSKLLVITRAGMRRRSGRGEEMMRSYRRIRRKKR